METLAKELEYTDKAFVSLKQQYIDALLSTKTKETEERDRLFIAIKTLETVRNHLEFELAGMKVKIKEITK